MVPLERLERSHPAPEAGALSSELQGHARSLEGRYPCPRILLLAAAAARRVGRIDSEALTGFGFDEVDGCLS